MFRGSTEENLSNKRLGEDDRKYMVRVLATMLCTYVQHPSMKDCSIVAESLLRKYSFLKESVSIITLFVFINHLICFLELMDTVHLCKVSKCQSKAL